jgi:hypothetical protein
VPKKPVEGWLDIIRHIDKLRDESRAEYAQLKEVFDALRERQEDFEIGIVHTQSSFQQQTHARQELFEQVVNAKIQFTNANTEDTDRKIDSHMGSHRLKMDADLVARAKAKEKAETGQIESKKITFGFLQVVIVALISSVIGPVVLAWVQSLFR